MDILSQRIVYAEIVPHRNYSKISDRELYEKKIRRDDEIEFLYLPDIHSDTKKIQSKSILLKPRHKNKKTKYFHSEKEEPIDIYYGSAKITTYSPFITTNDRHIKKHYGNPFSEIRVHTIERSVKIRNNKVTIKIYQRIRRREVNWIYFRSTVIIKSITIDLTTGNFTLTNIDDNKKIFRKNSFSLLNTMVHIGYLFSIKDRFRHIKLYDECNEIFSEEKFSDSINKSLGFTFPNYSKDKRVFFMLFIKKFVELKKIKIPNDFEFLLTNYYPTEKFLKKNDRKLIASILDFFGIKSKVTIKLLHNNPSIDMYTVYCLCKFFGSDYHKYIGNLDDKLIFKHPNYTQKNTNEIHNKVSIMNIPKRNFILLNKEKDTLMRLLNSLHNDNMKNVLDKNFIQLLIDHFIMIEKIREYDPDYVMKSKNYKEFHEEHTELSKMISAIRKGWVIEYKFNDEMVREIEKPITVKINLWDTDNPQYEEITFQSYLLKREEEYIEEGNVMHHCVATYSDKDRSVIVSIRNDDKTDRITCEFDTQTGACIQARHFCNKQPPGDMELALDILKEKMKYYARLGMLHSVEKLKVPLKINGKEVEPELPQPIFPDHLFNVDY